MKMVLLNKIYNSSFNKRNEDNFKNYVTIKK